MAKVIMRYEVTNYKEIEMEVPDEIYNDVMETKKVLEAFSANNDRWWESVEHDNYDHACDRLEEWLDFDAPYIDDPWANNIYILGINTEDGEELIGW